MPKGDWHYFAGVEGPFVNHENNISADFTYLESEYENLLDKDISVSYNIPENYVLGGAGQVYYLLLKYPEEPKGWPSSPLKFMVTAQVAGKKQTTKYFRHMAFAGSRPVIHISSVNDETTIRMGNEPESLLASQPTRSKKRLPF